jgi:hypothetical protein
MADDIEEDGIDDATQAFEGLRAEIAVLCRAVEAIEPVLRDNQAPDYSPTLGALTKSLDAIASRIEAIETHTGATVPAEVARREIARVYDASLRPARGDLERATREVLDAAHALHGAAGHTRTREEQRGWIIRAAAIGAAVGLLAFPPLVFPIARLLPFGNLPDSLAASALGTDRWTAGTALMSRADPGRWTDLVEGYTAAHSAGGDLKACLDAAQKVGKEQRCSITIRPAPAP